MSQEQHPDIVWNERMDRMTRLMKEGFPELDDLGIFKLMDDWMVCNDKVSEEDYVRHCFARALDMYDNFIGGITSEGRPLENFTEFIRPAIELFFKEAHLSDAAIVALISEIIDFNQEV